MTGINNSDFLCRMGVSCEMGRRRHNNEDNFYLDGRFKELDHADYPVHLNAESSGRAIIAVCDGMGGENCGEYASWQAVKTLSDFAQTIRESGYPDRRVDEYIREANLLICAAAARQSNHMGATLALAVVDGPHAMVYNLGDSRIYVISQGDYRKLSHDHTVAQDMMDMGLQPPKAHHAYHQLTQHLGIPEDEMLLGAYRSDLTISSGDRLLLCSDGLTDMLSESEIAVILSDGSAPADQAYALTKAAEQAGGKDNVTALVLSVETARGKSEGYYDNQTCCVG